MTESRHGGVEPDERLEEACRERILALADDPAGIEHRLAELEVEWDIERVMEANALVTAILGTGLALARKRRLVAGLPAVVALAVADYAVAGARPPVSLLRRLGFRTAEEIARERAALVALHGGLPFAPQPRPDLAAATLRRLRRVLRR